MRTQGAFYADTAHTGGWVYYDAMNLFGSFSGATISANMALTRNAGGDYSYNRTAAGAETYITPIGLANTKRLIESIPSGNSASLPFQNAFGTAAGGPGYPAGAAGVPPFTGATQLTQPTGNPAKGVQVTDVVAVYQVGVAALTGATLSLNRTVFANNVANAVTAVTISATALPTATQANPYVVVRAVTTPVFETSDLSMLSVELSLTLQNTGTIRVYGLGFHLNFNYN